MANFLLLYKFSQDFYIFHFLHIHRWFNITTIIPHSRDSSLEPKCFRVDCFSIHFSNLDYLFIYFSLHIVRLQSIIYVGVCVFYFFFKNLHFGKVISSKVYLTTWQNSLVSLNRRRCLEKKKKKKKKIEDVFSIHRL